jgi:hypothetical protein
MVLAANILIAYPASSFGQRRTVKLNENAFAYAKELIAQGHLVADKRKAWGDHHPTAEDENEFIRAHGFAEYGKWHLGIDESHAEGTKARYKFPFGDFENIHRCALLAVRSRARQYGYPDIENAALQLTETINSKKQGQNRRERGRRFVGPRGTQTVSLCAQRSYTPLKRQTSSNQESQLLRNASINSGRSSL